MLSIPNQLEGAYLGQDVMLECHTEAYPASINYWTTERGDMIISGNVYKLSYSFPMKYFLINMRICHIRKIVVCHCQAEIQ